jgi:hypothetical protein
MNNDNPPDDFFRIERHTRHVPNDNMRRLSKDGKMKRAIEVLMLFLASFSFLTASEKSHGTTRPPKAAYGSTGTPDATLLNIGNISMWAGSDGTMERRPFDRLAGVVFPRGTATIVYAGGFLWGGMVNDSATPSIRVGGQTYNIGTVPGAIIRPGVSENPSNADVRIYRIRRDWATADLRQDAADIYLEDPQNVTQVQIDAVREQYRKDWLEWPWQKGAPYYDRDGNPGYQPDPDGKTSSVTDEPGLGDADQVLWFVTNDLNGVATNLLYGSPPIGLEMQVTCWAYASTKPSLQNVIFQRCRLIYKGLATTPSNASIDSMYLAKWVDPDIGDYSDDYAGCSPARNMGYAYNSTNSDVMYDDFNLPPPAIGYDLVEGPMVPQSGGSAHWNLTTRKDFTNLPMTAFTYFTVGSRTTDYAFGSYDDTKAWWNILRGYQPAPFSPPTCMINPLTNQCTDFELDGDPVNLQGWLDGKVDPPGDRRILVSSGPFSLALGDTQEIIVAMIGALGKNNRDAVTALFSTDNGVKDYYEENFQTPSPVPVPTLRIVELNDTLMLDWEKDTAQVRKIESYQSQGFRFESYKIYQFRSPAGDLSTAYDFPPFDLNSSPRFITVTEDYLRQHTLVDGQQYYYAVTAVMFNPDPSYADPRIESPIVVKTATPHLPNPGTVYPYQIGTTAGNVIDFVGVNDATVLPIYYDPTQPDNHIYKILFHLCPTLLCQLEQKPTWDFIDSTSNDTLVKGVFTDQPPQRVVSRGLTIQVLGVPYYLRDVVEINPQNPLEKSDVFNHPNPGGQYMVVSGGESVLDTLKSATTKDNDVELRFSGDSSWTVFPGKLPRSSRWVRVPFSAWQLNVDGRDTSYYHLYTFVTDFGTDSVWRTDTSLNQYYNNRKLRVFYPITIMIGGINLSGKDVPGLYNDQIPFSADSFLVKAFIWEASFGRDQYTVIWKAYIADLNEDGVAAPKGTVIRFERYHQIHDLDQKLFIPRPVALHNIDAARRAVERINVFPNPYYGMNRVEVNSSQRFVTFNHLPYHAVVRLFNIAGTLVRTIKKDDPTQFVNWDLNNEYGLPVAGGVYLAHLQLTDATGISLGEKVLKLMIVPEEKLFNN